MIHDSARHLPGLPAQPFPLEWPQAELALPACESEGSTRT